MEFLCLMRTCTTQSCTYFAERVMSILNIAYQRYLLEIDKVKENLQYLK